MSDPCSHRDRCSDFVALSAEIERLTAELVEERRMIRSTMVEKLTAQLAEAAAFLDGLANRCDLPPTSITQIAFDCRAMAAKLRGKA